MPERDPEQTSFLPKGAVAFFAAMVAAYAVLWVALYLLMAHRA